MTRLELDALIASRPNTISQSRAESLHIALDLGADDATIATLADATRLSRGDTIILPMQHLETLSRGRGRGWARKYRGKQAEWGTRTDKGYRVGPGVWTVAGSDGLNREKRDEWTVKHVTVGQQTWTVAN